MENLISYIAGLVSAWFVNQWPQASTVKRWWQKRFSRARIGIDDAFVLLGVRAVDVQGARLQPGLEDFQIQSTYTGEFKRRPDDVERAAASQLESYSRQRRLENRPYDKGGRFAVNSISHPRQAVAQGHRATRHTIAFAPSTYERFLWPNHIVATGTQSSVVSSTEWRKQCGLTPELLSQDRLNEVCVDVTAGVNVVVRTSDGYGLFACRSYASDIAPQTRHTPYLGFHVSVAEAMFRNEHFPDQSDLRDGLPHPSATVRRGLRDELGLMVGDDFVEADLRNLGWVIDQHRGQVLFVYFAQLAADRNRVKDAWASGPADKHENRGLIFVPFEIQQLLLLFKAPNLVELRGYTSIGDVAPQSKFEFASNHARVSTALAIGHYFSPETLALETQRMYKSPSLGRL